MPDRILLVTPASPYAPQSGAQQRTALLFDALKTLGEVDVLLLEPTSEKSHLATAAAGIQAHGFWQQRPLGINKFQPDNELNRALESFGMDLGKYTLIVGRYLNPISKLVIPAGVRTIVDLDDWGYHYPAFHGGLAARLKSAYAPWLGSREFSRFDAFFFVREREQTRYPSLRSSVLPNIPFAPPEDPFPQVDSTTLLFVGSLWYGPNREGIDHFLQHCWPRIKRAQPDASLLLVGAASPAIRADWEKHPDVRAPGFVDDLAAAYHDAAFTIAPIYAGGGTNIKILESLAYGRACVTTRYCADGFAFGLTGAGMVVARNDEHYSRLCIDWLNNAANRQATADRGHTQLQKNYTKNLFLERVTQLATAVLQPPPSNQ